MKEFMLRPEHIKLLKKAYIGWNDCEFGAPEIDPKRPYGNSYVYGDIAEILGIQPNEDGGFTQQERDYMSDLHEGTQTALQIAVANLGKKISIGKYIADDYRVNWRYEE